jgi:hypothetical protein
LGAKFCGHPNSSNSTIAALKLFIFGKMAMLVLLIFLSVY